MSNKNLTKGQLTTLIISFLLGNTLAVSGGIIKGEKYGYITVFIAFLIFLLFIKMYEYTLKKNDYCDFYTVIKNCFSKPIYKIIMFAIFIFSFFSALMSSLNVVFFVIIASQGKVSLTFFAILLCLCLYSIITKDKKTLGRYCSLVFYGVIFLFLIMIIFGFFKGDYKNLYISLPISVPTVLKSTLYNFLAPFSDIFLIYIFAGSIYNPVNISKPIKLSGFFSAIILSAVYFVNVIILGKNLMSDIYYPTLFSFGVINPLTQISRSEAIYYTAHLFFDIIYICVSLFVCKDSFFKLFSKESKENKENKKNKTKERIFSLSAVSFILLYILLSGFSGKFYNLYEAVIYLKIPINIGIVALCFIKSIKNQSKCISEKLM